MGKEWNREIERVAKGRKRRGFKYYLRVQQSHVHRAREHVLDHTWRVSKHRTDKHMSVEASLTSIYGRGSLTLTGTWARRASHSLSAAIDSEKSTSLVSRLACGFSRRPSGMCRTVM